MSNVYKSSLIEAASKVGAEVIEVDKDTSAIDIRGMEYSTPVVIVTLNPSLRVMASKISCTALGVFGVRPGEYKNPVVLIDLQGHLDDVYDIFTRENSKRERPNPFGLVVDITRGYVGPKATETPSAVTQEAAS